MFKNIICSISALVLFSPCFADMREIDDMDLSEISGKGGVYLSGEFAINKTGGPLWDDPVEVDGFAPGSRPVFNSAGNIIDAAPCEGGVCGLRLAIQLDEGSEGWFILDDVSGGLSFEGLTLQTETLLAGTERNNQSNDAEVLKIGLPDTISFNNYKFKFAAANNGEFGVPLADGTPFRQTDIFGVQLDGDIAVGGNLLLFPVD